MNIELFDFPQLGINDDETWPPFPSAAGEEEPSEHIAPPLDIPLSSEWTDILLSESMESNKNNVPSEGANKQKLIIEQKEKKMFDDSGPLGVNRTNGTMNSLIGAFKDPRSVNSLVDTSLVHKTPVAALQPIQGSRAPIRRHHITDSFNSVMSYLQMTSSSGAPPPNKIAKLSAKSGETMKWSHHVLEDEGGDATVTKATNEVGGGASNSSNRRTAGPTTAKKAPMMTKCLRIMKNRQK